MALWCTVEHFTSSTKFETSDGYTKPFVPSRHSIHIIFCEVCWPVCFLSTTTLLGAHALNGLATRSRSYPALLLLLLHLVARSERNRKFWNAIPCWYVRHPDVTVFSLTILFVPWRDDTSVFKSPKRAGAKVSDPAGCISTKHCRIALAKSQNQHEPRLPPIIIRPSS